MDDVRDKIRLRFGGAGPKPHEAAGDAPDEDARDYTTSSWRMRCDGPRPVEMDEEMGTVRVE